MARLTAEVQKESRERFYAWNRR